uniref:Ig-like domain-containing protein n=1 Tax=Scleropages formosus TaxID=113540 RepID=A0A8C9SSY2_SCLFO
MGVQHIQRAVITTRFTLYNCINPQINAKSLHFNLIVVLSLGVDADKVEQQPLMYFLEGDKALLTCNHDITNFNSMYWYVQHVNKEPEYIIHGFNEGRSTNLSISDTQTEDSAVYYCAVQPTVTATL